jgi:hypothetical protein
VIQIACVQWGTRYGPESVNRLYRAVTRAASVPIRFVCISDRTADAYDAGVETVPFPPFALPRAEMERGCRLKLALFAPGVLEPDLPTVYFDLDTMVLGDVAPIAALPVERPALYMLKNHLLPFWRVQPLLKAVGVREYYFANSSVMAFFPRAFAFVYAEFNRRAATMPRPVPKAMKTDDRFVSDVARDQLRVVPRRLAVKFPDEYMAPFLFVEAVRKRLPWVAMRRRALVAVAFVGAGLKPASIAAFRPGEIVHYKRRRCRWEEERYGSYWRDAA